MSSISMLPYGKILDYWNSKLEGHNEKYKFLVTKFIETYAFKVAPNKSKKKKTQLKFPVGHLHDLPIKPKVALVIPSYVTSLKDKLDVEKLFTSIVNQRVLPDEIVVVDDCSTLEYQVPENFNFIGLTKNKGSANARNKGIELALSLNCQIIAFIDVDCVLDVNWIKQVLYFFQKNKDFQICSGITKSLDNHWFGRYHDINGTLNGRAFKNFDGLLYGTTANLAITSNVAEKVVFNDIFPTAAGEDIEFCFRAIQEGFKIGLNPEMIVHHHYGYGQSWLMSTKRFYNQFKRYGKGERILLEQIPEYYSYFEETMEINSKDF